MAKKGRAKDRFHVKVINLYKKYDVETVVVRALTFSGPLRSAIVGFYRLIGKNKKKVEGTGTTIFKNFDVDATVAEIRKKGVSIGIQLPQEAIDEIWKFSITTPAYANVKGKPNVIVNPELSKFGPVEKASMYTILDPHKQLKLLNDISMDKTVLDVVRKYIGIEPNFYASRLYWSYPKRDDKGEIIKEGDDKNFHYDVPDCKSLSLFFYITDVGKKSGPHTLIEGTHGNRTLFQLTNWKLDYNKAVRHYKEKVIDILGKKGMGFFEELTIYHRHTPGEIDEPRLMLNFTYVMSRSTPSDDY